MRTSCVDVVLCAFKGLQPDEQEEALERCRQHWVSSHEEHDSEAARMLASLQRVAEVLGCPPGIEDYKRVRKELAATGEALEPSSRIIRHFDGSWHLAREALDLSAITTPRRIEERFRKRHLGKVWRYSEQQLGDFLREVADAVGHVPLQAELEWYRQRQLDLAHAAGEELHLPSATPYRRRWGTWEKALERWFDADQVPARLERP